MSLKDVKKLHDKKYRTETGLFFVEGRKSVLECIGSDLEVIALYVTEAFYEEAYAACRKRSVMPHLDIVPERALEAAGTFITNDGGIALIKQRAVPDINEILKRAQNEIVLVLDDIRDPGNLGTIIRTSDWFGITSIVASLSTVDMYNPKVVSGTMGSLTHVDMVYTDLSSFLMNAHAEKISTIGAVLNGEPTHTTTIPERGLIVMGSESHGIHPELLPYITTRITIPKYGKAESLNVSIATGIILSLLKNTNS